MKQVIAAVLELILMSFLFGACNPTPSSEAPEVEKAPIIFATYAEYPQQVLRVRSFCESIRTHAGSMSRAPIRFYFTSELRGLVDESRASLEALSVELRSFEVPDDAPKVILAGKPFAAARAEADAAEEVAILAFLDANVLILREPSAFHLESGTDFAYRPVMHRNIGSLYDEPPDEFWSRIYAKLSVDESRLFPMEGIADKLIIRPYYNAGHLVVRPERGVLRKWAENFQMCYQDPELAEMCEDEKHNIFLHQAVLSATVPVYVEREKTADLGPAYNYPLFFDTFYESERSFDSLEDVVSLKYEFNFNDLPADWDSNLKGPSDVIAWIKTHCVRDDES
jgi:hypothetical protein